MDFDRYDQIYYDFFSKRGRIDIPYRIHKCKKACDGCLDCAGRNYNLCYYDCKTCKRCMQLGAPYFYNSAGYFGVPHHMAYKVSDYAMATGECDSVCGAKACDEYRMRMQMYRDCLIDRSKEECDKEYGCATHRGFRRKFHPPINPKYTSCQMCWRNGFTTI